MKNLKKKLRNFGVWCLVLTSVNFLSLGYNFYNSQLDICNVSVDVVGVILSVITGVVYIVYSNKSKQELIQTKNTFFILSLINILNNTIVWILTFWAQFVVNRELLLQTKQDNADATLEKRDSSIQEKAKLLTEKLEELKEKRDKNLITEEEYENLRQEIIKNYIN